MNKKVLITGITGQDGAYLSELLLKKNYEIFGIVRPDDDYSKLEYLGIKNKIKFFECDLLNPDQVCFLLRIISPNEIYNFAAQSSVGISLKNPDKTLQFNIMSALNLLEAIRTLDLISKFFQPSSSEIFGDQSNLPINEETVFNPLNPYAVSKTCAHMIVKNYRNLYGIFACCGILFNHESYLRGDNFFIKKVIRDASAVKNGSKNCVVVGNLDIKRDIGFAPEYVKAMWLMLQQKDPTDLIICSGKSISLREIVYYIFDRLSLDYSKIIIDKKLFRPFDIKDIYGDNSRAKDFLDWKYQMDFRQVLDILIDEEINEIS